MANVNSRAAAIGPFKAPVQSDAVSNRVNSSSLPGNPPAPEFIVAELPPVSAGGSAHAPSWLPAGAISAQAIIRMAVSLDLRERFIYAYAYAQNAANTGTTTAYIGLSINLLRAGQTVLTLPYTFIYSPTGGNIGQDIPNSNLSTLTLPNIATPGGDNCLVLQPITPVYVGGTAGVEPNEPALTVLSPYKVYTPIDLISVDLLPMMVTGGNLRLDLSTIRIVIISSASR